MTTGTIDATEAPGNPGSPSARMLEHPSEAVEDVQTELDAQDDLIARLHEERAALDTQISSREALKRIEQIDQDLGTERKWREKIAKRLGKARTERIRDSLDSAWAGYDAGEPERSERRARLLTVASEGLAAAEALVADDRAWRQLQNRANVLSGPDGPLAGERLPRRPYPGKPLGLTSTTLPALVQRMRELASMLKGTP